MLNLKEIRSFYPESLQKYEKFIYREYLQYKILEIVFESPFANKLSFLGGTCLRIVHNNNRFSEDIDFDNFNLTTNEFKQITEFIERRLKLLGYNIEIRNISKGAYHCYIKFPKLLFDEGLSGHKEEKILIQLDTEAHNYEYKPDQSILNKFDVFTQINSTPESILLSQKFYAVINRKRNKGRDFFDIIFLLGHGVLPDYKYLNHKIGVNNPEELRSMILEKCSRINMKEMVIDVQPFLFNHSDAKRILLFAEYLKEVNLK